VHNLQFKDPGEYRLVAAKSNRDDGSIIGLKQLAHHNLHITSSSTNVCVVCCTNTNDLLFCSDCDEGMCKGCSRKRHTFALAHHRVSPWNSHMRAARKVTQKCSNGCPDTRAADFYCKTCDRLYCRDCNLAIHNSASMRTHSWYRIVEQDVTVRQMVVYLGFWLFLFALIYFFHDDYVTNTFLQEKLANEEISDASTYAPIALMDVANEDEMWQVGKKIPLTPPPLSNVGFFMFCNGVLTLFNFVFVMLLVTAYSGLTIYFYLRCGQTGMVTRAGRLEEKITPMAVWELSVY
jgi:hypothetical protein